MRHRRFVIILVLSLWVLAGALAPMCGSQCLGMSMTCCTSSFCVPVPGVQATLPSPTLLTQRTVFHAAGLASPDATRESADASSERPLLLRLAFCNGSSLVPEIWPTRVFT